MAIISAFRRLKQKILTQDQFLIHSDAVSKKSQEKEGERLGRRGEIGGKKKGRRGRRKSEGKAGRLKKHLRTFVLGRK